jgi:hypothetical protein
LFVDFFNDAISNLLYSVGLLDDTELRIGIHVDPVIVTYFKALSWNLFGGKNLRYGSWYPDRDSKRAPPGCKTEAVPLE